MAGTSNPVFLYPTGAPPHVPAGGGYKSLFAFWMGGACGTTFVPPAERGGAGKPRKSTPERRRLREHRPNYDAVAEAYREAEERARELEAKKRKKALAALRAAEELLAEVRAGESAVDLAPLTQALEAAAQAPAFDFMEYARRVNDIARRALEEIDEEEVEMLLLSH